MFNVQQPFFNVTPFILIENRISFEFGFKKKAFSIPHE